MKVLDVDNDGRLDMLVRVPGAVKLLRNNGDLPLSFTESTFATLDDDLDVDISAVGDLNGDGKLDLVGTKGYGSKPIYWYEDPISPFSPVQKMDLPICWDISFLTTIFSTTF
jgi:hypothetical protein